MIDVPVLSVSWSFEDHSVIIQALRKGLIEHEASDTGGIPRWKSSCPDRLAEATDQRRGYSEFVELLHYCARRFAPRAASAAHYARSQAIEQNANEADREVHEFRCKLMTCKFQNLHARGYQPGRRIMYPHVPGAKCTYTKRAKISGRFPNK